MLALGIETSVGQILPPLRCQAQKGANKRIQGSRAGLLQASVARMCFLDSLFVGGVEPVKFGLPILDSVSVIAGNLKPWGMENVNAVSVIADGSV